MVLVLCYLYIYGGRGWEFADPAMSLIIALVLMYSTWPVLTRTANLLLQTTPSVIYPQIYGALHAVRTIYRLYTNSSRQV